MSLLLLFPSLPATPTVVTGSATSVTSKTATLGGTIYNTGPNTVTERGFEWNTTAYPANTRNETGSFSSGAYTLSLGSLTPGQIYFFRAYVIVGGVTYYGDWTAFATLASTYSVLINGTDRTTDVINQTISIEDIINDQQNICTFSLIDRSSNGIPSTDQEVIITLDGGTVIFGGYIVSVNLVKKGVGVIKADIKCLDYVRLLDRNLAHKSYENMTDKAIIEDLVATYCAGFGITTTNVVEGVTISQISFNYIQISQALKKISKITGRNWYIDYSKDIHYFPLTTNVAPFNISSSNNEYIDLKISKDASQIKNRVYVRGGTKLSDATYYETKGDGVARQFVLPDKPHSVTVKVNGVAKTLGIKNIDTSGYDFYLNFEEKYVEQDSGGVVLATTDTLRVDYQYDIPILVAVEDTASILANGQKEFAIFDKNITTTQAARDRASAELTDYANSIVEGTFKTYTPGFVAGQYININLSDYGVNADYIVQKVVAKAFGAGEYIYEISVASAKTMGIIKFLIDLLEQQKNVVELDDNEVIDELLSISDSLLSDSIVDSLTIDSAGPYSTWAVANETTPITTARWDLFQWG